MIRAHQLTLLLLAAPFFSIATHAQDAKAIVATAVKTELAADRDDHTAFMYRDHDVTPDHDTLYYVVETHEGALKKKLEDHGRPLTPDERRDDDQKIQALVNDPAAMARIRRDSSHDDNQAEQMLRLLPTAFLWTVVSDTPSLVTLSFKPDPNFSPGVFDPESKVLGAMGGQITVERPGMHIASIKGTLLSDVNFFGFLGHLRKGGSFEVIRKDVAGGHWQMTEQHVHINGHALFFKTISSNEDELRKDFKISTVLGLPQAYDVLKDVK
jgi:hypothetical protein